MLTFVGDIDGLTRRDDGESVCCTRLGCNFGDVTNQYTSEVRGDTGVIGNVEGLCSPGRQSGAGIPEEFQGLVTGVGEGGHNLESADIVEMGGC